MAAAEVAVAVGRAVDASAEPEPVALPDAERVWERLVAAAAPQQLEALHHQPWSPDCTYFSSAAPFQIDSLQKPQEEERERQQQPKPQEEEQQQ